MYWHTAFVTSEKILGVKRGQCTGQCLKNKIIGHKDHCKDKLYLTNEYLLVKITKKGILK